jgi:hypothetical protein
MIRSLLPLFVLTAFVCGSSSETQAEMTVVQDGRAAAQIVVDTRGSEGSGPAVLRDAAEWLTESIQRSTGADVAVAEELADGGAAIVIARADAWPDVSKNAGLKADDYDAYCIVTRADRVYILGGSEAAARHGVSDLLRRWGFRWFAPSPRWHIVPERKSLAIDVNLAQSPALSDRRIWYAYGMRGDDLAPLMENYTRWAVANRLSVRSLARTGHSYGNIIRRNEEQFARHPEYYALLPDGKRDSERAVNARKFCYSNPGLIELVAEDRLRLLEEQRRANPAAYMVSVDPSDGEGTCHCENCQALGTTTDRVLHLANEVARRLRREDPRAWVGLYAYSSHRLPPTIDVEPNVYVQVAMGFNHTQYTLPELVELWSKKVGAIGLREYYGVEAWDWGLPGRMRGGQVDYHRRWIPYYAARKLNAVNAETNANWGGQTLGLYVAAQMMWDPGVDVDQLTDEFFTLSFGDAADTMRSFYARLDAAPPLRSATLLPLFADLETAWADTKDEDVRRRLVDLMAYLVYVAEYRDFDLVRSRQSSRNDAYYAALKPLMQYAWRIRHRDMVHYYALARRLCNGLPVKDQRPAFYMFNKERAPVWQEGEPLTDAEIRARFQQTIDRLRADDDPTVTFSRLLDRVQPPGEDAGPSGILARDEEAVARFRGELRGWLVPGGRQQVEFGVTPLGKRVQFAVSNSRGEVLHEQQLRPVAADSSDDADAPPVQKVVFELPKAGEYRVDIRGELELHVPRETPFVLEASVMHPAWISYSGPHYFYVPRGTKQLIVDAGPRLSLQVPGEKKRRDIQPADRREGAQYVVIDVPDGADGRVWHTTNMTRGKVSLLNVPPLLSFHRDTVLVPREVAESEGLSTSK